MKKIKRWNPSCATLKTLHRREMYGGRKGRAAWRRHQQLRRDGDRIIHSAAARIGWAEVERRLLTGEDLEGG